MPPVHRRTDLTTGHGCWPPIMPQTWSHNVKANTLEVIRYNDVIVPHCCPPCHQGAYIGVNNVKVNGRYLQRIGHPVS